MVRAVLYAPAGAARGIGHSVRSLALAEEALARGWEVVLAGDLNTPSDGLLTGVPGLRRTLVGSTTELIEVAAGADVVHLDCYDKQLDGLSFPGALLSCMADAEYGLRPADLTVDVSPSAPGRLDRLRGWTKGQLLLGPRFAPLRHAVTSRRGSWRPPIGDPCSVLVVMGGTDAAEMTVPVVAALASRPERLQVTVVGSVETHAAVKSVWDTTGNPLRLLPFVEDLPGEAIQHDLVVTASGTTVWELCCLGVPMALVCAVPNQRDNYTSLVGQKAAIGLSSATGVVDEVAANLGTVLTTAGELKRLSLAASRLVDGHGSWRVVSAWETLRLGPGSRRPGADVGVRPAVPDDSALLLGWRNDPLTRQFSRQIDPVPQAVHQQWYARALTAPDRRLLIATLDGDPVGTVRWDRVGDSPWEKAWEVSITVAPGRRGGGLSLAMLAAAEKWLLGTVAGPVRLVASVHQTNLASLRLFTRAGYLPDQPADDAGFLCLARSEVGRAV